MQINAKAVLRSRTPGVHVGELLSLTSGPAARVNTIATTATPVIAMVSSRSTYSRPPSAWLAARVICGTRTALRTPPASSVGVTHRPLLARGDLPADKA